MGVGTAPLSNCSRRFQIPPDFVVKSQAIDVAEVILARIRQPNVVSTLWGNRQSRRERLSTSEAHGSTTKSDGMCAGFMRLASYGYMDARIVHSLWLIEAEPHRRRVHFITTQHMPFRSIWI